MLLATKEPSFSYSRRWNGQVSEHLIAQWRFAFKLTQPTAEEKGTPEVKRGRKAVASVQSDCVARAVHDLADTGSIGMTEEVRQALLELVAMPGLHNAAERARVEAAAQMEQARRTGEPFGNEALQPRIFGSTFRVGAGPGPSAIRNAHIAALARLPHGVDAIRAFATIEVTGLWLPEDAVRWRAAIIVPQEEG